MVSKHIAFTWRSCVSLLLLCLAAVVMAAPSIDESTLKAIFTYKFSKFTEWPQTTVPPSTGSFTLCILGENSLSHHSLNAIRDKSVKNLPLHILLFRNGILPTKAIDKCQMLFVSHSEKHRIPSILQALEKKPILTLSDINDFSQQGGMITFRVIEQQLRFEINVHAIEAAGLTLASIILELGAIVTTEPHQEL